MKTHRSVNALVILALWLSPLATTGFALQRSPFVGVWRAIDYGDGSLMRATIMGPVNGPFMITWTESYFSFCGGPAGVAIGVGRLTAPDTLEADMRLKCFLTGDSLSWHQVWQYRPAYDVLASYGDYEVETIWTRLGRGLVPRMDLRVNYGHDWVESFYEAGHNVEVTVTESDEVTVKATASAFTEPKDYWGGEPGFQTEDAQWTPSRPDIQPGDWVYAQMDNGLAAKVQIGAIAGTIDLIGDSISGTILAEWFPEVAVECLDWFSPTGSLNKDAGLVPANGEAPYGCSWAGEWDLEAGQTVGVGYSGPDGHWVANAFLIPMPTFGAYVPGAVEGYSWPMGHTITLNVNSGEYVAQAISEQRPDSPEGETRVLFELWRDDFFLEAGDHVTMTDESIGLTKDTVVTNLTVTGFDLSAGTVTGIFDPAFRIWVWLYGGEGQVPYTEGGIWVATFDELPPGASGGATQWDADGDVTSIDFQVPNPHFSAFPEWETIEGWDWPEGAAVDASVAGKPECTASGTSGHPEWDPNVLFVAIQLPGDCDLAAQDEVTLTDGSAFRTHTVRNLAVTGTDAIEDTVAGTSDPGAQLHVWPHGYDELQPTADGSGLWAADFTETVDLVEGMCGRTEIRDDQGNATAVDWCLPSVVRLIAFPAVDGVFGYGWPEGSDVSLSINGAPVQTVTVGPSPWDPNDIGAFFLHDNPDLEAADLVFLSGSGLTETHSVFTLAIAAVDKTANTVSGTADEGATVHAWIFGVDGSELELTAGGGSWLADFGSAGFDLTEGTCGRAEIRDDQANSTAVDWCAPSGPETQWVGVFMYTVPDGTWAEGTHTYTYESMPSGETTPVISFAVSSEPPAYNGYVLLRPFAVRARIEGGADGGCPPIDPNLRLTQATRFVWGEVPESLMTYEDALAYFESLTVRVIWDGGGSAQLELQDLLEWEGLDWLSHVCSYAVRAATVSLTADSGWVETGFDVQAGLPLAITAEGVARTALDEPGLDGAVSGPDGQTWNLGCGQYEVAPPPCAMDGAPYGALVGKIGEDGVPFLIGSGLLLTPTSPGRLYLAVNDNLGFYGDNSGEYLVYLP